MRSLAEIRYRLAQEAGNLWLFLRRPECDCPERAPLRGLPDPAPIAERLCTTPYRAEVERLAEKILRHDFPLLGIEIRTGPEIRWRRDYLHGIETGTPYFRRIPYLDARRAGDHKIIWELNRHQHLVLLAQAWRLTNREEFYGELTAQLENWLAENPFQRGINWSSALEAAFRALSWIWVYHLAGERMEERFRRRFLAGLYRHGLHLERNLSVYFSRNTHLLGEAVALHALGSLFPSFPGARRWAETGARIVGEEMDFQVREDGSQFEQSTYYHVYALDMLLLHTVLANPGAAFREKLARMADYLEALLGPAGAIPFLGDDDGGRLFHPYGRRDRFGRATMATASALLNGPCGFQPEDVPEQAAWWLGEQALGATPPEAAPTAVSRLFRDAGLAVMCSGDLRVYMDAGPLGTRRAGHGHADTLSIVVRKGEEEILIDPGTYTYVSEPEWRNRFRGTAAHNTVRIDGRDQATAVWPFGWAEQPETRILEWSSSPTEDVLQAECRYGGLTHRRTVRLQKPDTVAVVDEIEGPGGECPIEQFWHPAGPVDAVSPNCFRIAGHWRLGLDAALCAELSEGGEYGWRSEAFGSKTPSPVIRATITAGLPVRLETVLAGGPAAWL